MTSSNGAPTVPESHPLPMKSHNKPLLLAVDNSEAAIKLADYVVGHFNKDTPVAVLHVQPEENYALAAGAGAAMLAWERKEELDQEAMLKSAHFLHDEIAPKLHKAGFKVNTALLHINGNSASQIGSAICRHADTIDASMIAMTKVSKSALTKFFTGSVTRFALDHTDRPLVIC